MSKKDLSETDICDLYITPALHDAGWKRSQIRREYTFTDGQMRVRGQIAGRGPKKRADYVLFHHTNQPISVVEAKDNKHAVTDGIQQALRYADSLGTPFVGYGTDSCKNGPHLLKCLCNKCFRLCVS